MAQLASSFEEYGQWRDALAAAIVQLRQWLVDAQMLDPDAARRIDVALDRLAEDKLVIAFVAEFSRGKSELINAIFFADYGKRILPSSAGRTTMCPTELLYDESMPPCIRALPIETRSRLGSTSDFKRLSEEWQVFPLDTSSADGMLNAFKIVAETVRVPVDEARSYALFDADDPDQAIALDKNGMVEISKWRHAVINFPHPLLKHGLVILDTPGLNAIGTEPELTLSLVPNAHAVLFVLAADTGVTKSDLDVWRHVVGDAGHRNHIAVLNKIDGLWDVLKTPGEIELEVRHQCAAVAATLDLEPMRVFPVSAQKGLVAKVQNDPTLLEASRLPLLEEALIDLLVPTKQQIVRDQTVAQVERVASEARQTLAARERGVIEQLYELRGLQGKNQSSIERMTRRALAEQREFEEVVRKIVAARVVLQKLSDKLFVPLRVSTLRAAGPGDTQQDEEVATVARHFGRRARLLRQPARVAAGCQCEGARDRADGSGRAAPLCRGTGLEPEPTDDVLARHLHRRPGACRGGLPFAVRCVCRAHARSLDADGALLRDRRGEVARDLFRGRTGYRGLGQVVVASDRTAGPRATRATEEACRVDLQDPRCPGLAR